MPVARWGGALRAFPDDISRLCARDSIRASPSQGFLKPTRDERTRRMLRDSSEGAWRSAHLINRGNDRMGGGGCYEIQRQNRPGMRDAGAVLLCRSCVKRCLPPRLRVALRGRTWQTPSGAVKTFGDAWGVVAG